MKTAIFGLGYTGKRLFEFLDNKNHSVCGFSSRTKLKNSVIHDFSNSGEFPDLDNQDCSITTFPLHSLDYKKYTNWMSEITDNFYLFSSTGVFQRTNCLVNEQSPKDSSHKRFESEQYWLSRGGRIIYLSGIFGENRNPADWVRSGKVVKNPRQLNMVHISDIITHTTAILAEGITVNELILSDGQIHTWTDICVYLESKGIIQASTEQTATRETVFIDSSLARTLIPHMQFADFWKELEKIN